jgi:hypothetical protein
MKARGCLLFLACAVAGLMALPATVTAKPHYVVRPKGLHLHAALPASNGYSASIDTSGHRQVVLTFSQGSYTISYKTLGRITRRGISADFGRLGHVSLRFRGKPHPRSSPLPSLLRECKGRKSVEERGVFFGNVRFRGERGFTGIKAQRVKGGVVRLYRRVCKGPSWLQASASSADDFEGKLLIATAQENGSKRSFLVGESSIDLGEGAPLGLAVEVAVLGKRVEGVAISKSAFALDETVFHLSPPGNSPVKAKVAPSWLFVGSATYLAEGDSPTWTGSLGARFPGSGQVSLAGPEFEADFCQATSLSRFNRCATKLESLRPFYGSGSHSQPLALARLSSLR